ncbi:MAG TPA: carboxymuconolactone decarboxylase family protein [Streptosporangiaceae bacterium]|nr:carboxymuconolactone decarboxylase family protein [Streptosporangiaceae bacterium]
MSNAFLTKGVRRSLGEIRYVKPVMPGSASGLVADVYAQAERDFGLIAAPLAMHSPAPALAAASWAMLRETLLATGSVPRAEKEAVAAAVSAGNACPYCVTVHTATSKALGNELDSVNDPGMKEIIAWAQQSGQPDPAPLAHPGYAELAGVAVTFHYLNRMVTIFLPKSPLPSLTPKAVGGWVMDMLASAMTAASPAPGAALTLLPDAPLPDEFSWAAGTPHVAAAFARASAAIEEAGQRAVPPRVREFVLDILDGQTGQPAGPSRAWADTEVARLDSADRAAGRLAILTALAPHQITRTDVAEARQSDDALLALTAWASMAAARKISSRLRQLSAR